MFALIAAALLAVHSSVPDIRLSVPRIEGVPKCDGVAVQLGSGFIIAAQPLLDDQQIVAIMTAHHVAYNMPCVNLRWYDGHVDLNVRVRSIHAEAYPNDTLVFDAVLGHDHAALKLAKKAPEFGDSISLVGFPNALPWTLIRGFISGAAQKVTFGGDPISGIPLQTVNSIPISTSDGFYFGVSGGPVFNDAGEVVALADSMAADNFGATVIAGYIVLIPSLQ